MGEEGSSDLLMVLVPMFKQSMEKHTLDCFKNQNYLSCVPFDCVADAFFKDNNQLLQEVDL